MQNSFWNVPEAVSESSSPPPAESPAQSKPYPFRDYNTVRLRPINTVKLLHFSLFISRWELNTFRFMFYLCKTAAGYKKVHVFLSVHVFWVKWDPCVLPAGGNVTQRMFLKKKKPAFWFTSSMLKVAVQINSCSISEGEDINTLTCKDVQLFSSVLLFLSHQEQGIKGCRLVLVNKDFPVWSSSGLKGTCAGTCLNFKSDLLFLYVKKG